MSVKQRDRILHPEFFHNEELAKLGTACQVLYAGLWTVSDREGRLRDIPKTIGGAIFPHTDEPVEKLLDKLEGAGFIQRYEAGGKKCIFVPTFTAHQKPHVNETQTKLPDPPDGLEKLAKQAKKKKPAKPAEKIPYQTIIHDLNEVAGRKFPVDIYRDMIATLWKMGYRVKDFAKVHRVKTRQWANDPKTRTWLRPNTLYQPKKFVAYLQEDEVDEDLTRPPA